MEHSISQEPSSESSHRIDVTLSPKVNLADYQNAIPVLRELSFVNNGSETLSQLDLTLQTSPAFVKAKTWRIESVAPWQQLRVTDLDVALDGGVAESTDRSAEGCGCLYGRPAWRGNRACSSGEAG